MSFFEPVPTTSDPDEDKKKLDNVSSTATTIEWPSANTRRNKRPSNSTDVSSRWSGGSGFSDTDTSSTPPPETTSCCCIS